MSDPQALLTALMAGGLLGALFFGGLWWTIGQALSAKIPALWIICSFILRTSVALAGFYAISGIHPEQLLASLLGFVMARLLVTRLTRSSVEAEARPRREANHAP